MIHLITRWLYWTGNPTAFGIFTAAAVLMVSAACSSRSVSADAGARAQAQASKTAGSPHATTAGATSRRRRSPKLRAAPTTWDQDVLDAFFLDATKLLPGGIPLKRSGLDRADTPPADTPAGGVVPSTESQATHWSELISREALEGEIKLLAPKLAAEVKSVRQFRAGGFRSAGERLGLLAVLFGVVAQYDGEIRWKREAAGLRDLLSAAAVNCESAGMEAYQEAKQRSTDLADLVRGGRVEVPQAKPVAAWADLADLHVLMKRMEAARDDQLKLWTANETAFERHSDAVVHEAEIVALLSHMIALESYGYDDDEEFCDFAAALRQQSIELIQSARRMQFAEVQAAVGGLRKSCVNCHNIYQF